MSKNVSNQIGKAKDFFKTFSKSEIEDINNDLVLGEGFCFEDYDVENPSREFKREFYRLCREFDMDRD